MIGPGEDQPEEVAFQRRLLCLGCRPAIPMPPLRSCATARPWLDHCPQRMAQFHSARYRA